MLLIAVNGCQITDSGLAPGSPAPPFQLRDLSGKLVSLSDFRGKFVVLNFLASWCAPCAQEMPALKRLHEKLKPMGGTVVAVGVDDDLTALKAFRDTHRATFPFLVDSTSITSAKYRIGGFPETLFINGEGKVVMTVDPSSGQPVTKFIGPREWDSSKMLGAIRRAMQ